MFTHADDSATIERLVALGRLSSTHGEREEPLQTVWIPDPGGLDAEIVMWPRPAFFAPTEQIALADAPGHICAELVSPYPPGVPVVSPASAFDLRTLLPWQRPPP